VAAIRKTLDVVASRCCLVPHDTPPWSWGLPLSRSDIPGRARRHCPAPDLDELRDLAVSAIFTPGATPKDIVATITASPRFLTRHEK